MVHLMAQSCIYVVDLVYCAYGMPWKKPTRLITNVSSLRTLGRACSGDHEHQELRGHAPDGRLWTRVACAYPPQLCEAYAACVREAVLSGDLKALRLEDPSRSVYSIGEHWHVASRWRTLLRGLWDSEEHINIQEVRTLTMLDRRLGRDRRNWDTRHLCFSDSLVSVGAMRKGRSSSVPLLRLLRRSAACFFAYGLDLCLRWVPTKQNWADYPSRGRRLPRKTPLEMLGPVDEDSELSGSDEAVVALDHRQL